MGFRIEDGEGNGRDAHVDNEGQLKVVAESHELQHHVSLVEGETYQAISTDTGITAKTQTVLHLKNTSTTHYLVISFIRLQAITNTASKPVVGEYWQLGFDDTVSSGGTDITPVNTNRSVGNVAPVTATGIDPTMAGTFVEIDRWYNDNSEKTYNKQGSIILPLNGTFSVRLTSTGTGQATARVTFMMISK